jgi:dethiobiotin synthetase
MMHLPPPPLHLPQGAFSCFVTGTDTEIGKTLVSAALLHTLVQRGIRVAAMKPIAAGAEWRDGAWHNEDADLLAQHVSVQLPTAITTPYLFQTPAAPHIAAQLENTAIDPAHILRCYQQVQAQADAVVVEGVGGFCVPINDTYSTADLAQAFGLPVVLVVGLRLGCISHALLTVEAIRARGLSLMGWVANTVDDGMEHRDANIQALQQRIASPLLGHIPRLGVPTAAQAAQYLDRSAHAPNLPHA